MNRHRRSLAIGFVAISLLLSGCGTPMYELTDKEEELIVQYSAYIVAKHNIYQKDGYASGAQAPEAEPPSESESEDKNPDDTSEPGGSENTEAPIVTVSLAEALGLEDGLRISYTGNEITTHVKEGPVYSENADEGCTFYVMKFRIENTTNQAIKVDNFSARPTFVLESKGVKSISEKTFLSGDLSGYMGTIEAQSSVDTILLFAVKTEDAQKIANPTLELRTDDTVKNIEY